MLKLAVAIICLASVTAGVALVYVPAGFIVGGVCGLFLMNEAS